MKRERKMFKIKWSNSELKKKLNKKIPSVFHVLVIVSSFLFSFQIFSSFFFIKYTYSLYLPSFLSLPIFVYSDILLLVYLVHVVYSSFIIKMLRMWRMCSRGACNAIVCGSRMNSRKNKIKIKQNKNKSYCRWQQMFCSCSAAVSH